MVTEKKPSLNIPSLLKAFKEDFNEAKASRQKLDEKINKWKSAYNGEPYGNEVEGRSQIVSRDIKKQAEWQHSALLEPFVSTPNIITCDPVTFEDLDRARRLQTILNVQFCNQFSRFNFMKKALKVVDQEGTVVVRTGWEYEEKETEVEEVVQVPNPDIQQLQMLAMQYQGNVEALQQIEAQMKEIPAYIDETRLVKKVVAVKNHPTAMICRNEDIFIDPTCEDNIDRCQFIVHRYESDITALKQSGLYKNLEKIVLEKDEEFSDTDYISLDDSNFKFKDKARKKLLVHEYWGNYDINDDGIAEPIVCTWVDNTVIRLEENPFPDKKIPFIVTPFDLVPFTLYGESNAELLDDVQRIKSAILRGFIDNMALSNNGQKGIRKGALDFQNKRRYLRGENFEFNGSSADFYDGHFNELPSSVFNILQLMNDEAESIRGVLDSASSRRLNIVRNISENLVKVILRKWIAYNAEFLSDGEQFRITNEEFVRLKKEDLEARVDINLTISTSDDDRAKAQELSFILQTIGPNEDPEVRKLLMIEIALLHRMPHLAEKLANYQPQPDPYAQQIQELQIQLLQAQVANEQAKAGENQIDQQLKGAKVQTELAKAKDITSRADMTDLDYLQKYYRTDKKEEIRKEQSQREHELIKEQLHLMNQPRLKSL